MTPNRNHSLKRNILFGLLFLLVASRLFDSFFPSHQDHDRLFPTTPWTIQKAFSQKRSNVLVEGTGTIVRILPDDLDGTPHQRFIVRIDQHHTVLIAHNIDLAPRVEQLQPGEKIGFLGEYIWNRQGGLVHWSHHDPQGQHPAGWLLYQGKYYQ